MKVENSLRQSLEEFLSEVASRYGDDVAAGCREEFNVTPVKQSHRYQTLREVRNRLRKKDDDVLKQHGSLPFKT